MAEKIQTGSWAFGSQILQPSTDKNGMQNDKIYAKYIRDPKVM